MITVRVETLGTLKMIIGTKNSFILEDNATVYDLLKRLSKGQREDLLDLLVQEGQPRNDTQVFLNGENIRFKHGVNTRLINGDTITILKVDAAGG